MNNTISERVKVCFSEIGNENKELEEHEHNNKKRMPVILKPDREKDWLSGEEISSFSKDEIDLLATTV